jgi:diguanylate cyclase (GGDEF)-like protein/PAS domain S-box-containing protein
MGKEVKNKWWKFTFLLCAILVGFPIQNNKVYGVEQTKSVLFISSYSESFITVPEQLSGLRKVFQNNNVKLEIEYMDTKRYATDENINNFYTSLKYKLEKGVHYDAVIVGDDAALQFATSYQEELFSELPIVFFGINDRERAEKAAIAPYMTGMVEETSLVENIKLAKSFNPDATKVMAIVDGTITGQGDQKQFEMACEEFEELESSVLNVSQYTFEDFGTMLEGIGDDTLLIFLGMDRDLSQEFLDLNKQYKLIKEHTKVPVYRASIGGVGAGLVGGKMINYEEFGTIAANLVMDIFAGKSIDSIPLIEETPYYYFFDYEIIKKYNMDENLIPDGSVLLNKKVNPLEKYRSYIIAIGIVFAFLSILAIVLFIDNIKRRKIQKQLQESHDELAETYEELAASEEELQAQYNIVEQRVEEVNSLYQKYEIAITSTNSAVWELDIETQELEISKNFERLVNKQIPNRGYIYPIIDELIHRDYRSDLIEEIKQYIYGKKEEVNIQIPTNVAEGEKCWILVRGKGIKNSEGEVNKIYGIILDITTMKEQEEYIEYIAKHDYLTQLPNRMQFMEILAEELKKKGKGAVLLFDIDDFKSINDTLGHVYGDELLKQIAQRMKSIMDKQMFVARMGGDEFLILLKDVDSIELVDEYVRRINEAFKQVFSFDGIEDYINFSMGITFYPKDSSNINQLIMNADTAMYKVKKGGKNSCIYYHEDMKTEIKSKKDIESIMRKALKDNGFCLYYQPQVEVETGRIVSFEALLRMKDYSINPSVFIPIAEETGYIIEIGRWVAKEAIRQMAYWKDIGFEQKLVAINFSGKQLRDRGYIDYVRALLKEYNIKEEYIEIEITEGILLENDVQTFEFLTELKKYGFKIALDDFGTGYSSLNYLTYLPVNKIKLDKSINDKFLELNNTKVMESLISLAHSLNLKITAEGIEDWSKFMKLKEGNCDYIQGYLFSKPLMASEIEKIYNNKFVYELD